MRRIAFLLVLAALAPAQEEEGCGEEEATEGGLDALEGLDWKVKPIDFAKVDRTIRKLPELGSEKPLFGLYLFGIGGETRVWAVLDASTKGKKEYDVLHLDRNADGDLTGKDELIKGERTSEGEISFTVGDFREPGTEVVHKGFTIRWTETDVRYGMKWAGGAAVEGPCGSRRAHFTHSPKEAPIFVPGTERPFDFEQWGSDALKRGKENDFKVVMGNRGDRPGAFTCVNNRFLPEGERILVQLVCKDETGVDRRLTGELKERGWRVVYHGPISVPKDAKPGPAIMRVRLPESSEFESFTSEIPVTIE